MKNKKYILFFVLTLSIAKVNAQQFQNPSFDSVYFGGIDRLWNWITSDAAFMGGNTSGDTMGPQQNNTLFTFQGHEIFGYIDVYNPSPYSQICVKLNTSQYKKNDGSPFETYLVNGEHYYSANDGYIDFSKCGVPFPYRPDSLNGIYQYIDSNTITTDYGICIILLKKYNSVTGQSDTIAYQEDSLSFAHGNWNNFSIPINYISSAQPDTMLVILKASSRPLEGSSFWLDNLEFVYEPNTVTNTARDKDLPIIYPNPNSGIIHIQENSIEVKHYRLIDLQGKIIKEGDFKNEILLPKSLKGILFLELYDKRGLIKTFNILMN